MAPRVAFTELYYITYYYMDKGILLATKTLVESIRHYIRDLSGVFSVCRAREWYTLSCKITGGSAPIIFQAKSEAKNMADFDVC